MPKLIIMMGLQGSGKSTQAEKLHSEMPNSILLSTDAIRQKRQINNQEVFEIIYRQMNFLLRKGKDVIFDATNINLKHRSGIYRALSVDPRKVFIEVKVMATPYEECLARVNYRNKNGGHYVPLEVVENYYHKFEIPVPNESMRFLGKPLDKITIEPGKQQFDSQKFEEIKRDMDNFDQKNPMHNRTLGHHCDEVMEHYSHYKQDKIYQQFALFHDYGKMFTQTIDNLGRAHYYGHENVGAYRLLSQDSDLIDLDDSRDFLGMIALVNYHMLAFNWDTKKLDNKWTSILGQDLHDDLVHFNESDQVRE